jgi:anti-sigma B factor antagonist
MSIDMRVVGDVRIFDCSGKITLGEATLAIRTTLRAALDSGAKKILFNLKDVNYIDSSGLGEFMRIHTSVAAKGGQLRLLHLTARIRELLTVSKLLTIFQVYDDEKAALASFDQPAAHSESAKA